MKFDIFLIYHRWNVYIRAKVCSKISLSTYDNYRHTTGNNRNVYTLMHIVYL